LYDLLLLLVAEALDNRFDRAAAVDHGEDFDAGLANRLRHAVAVQDALSHVDSSELRHHASNHRLLTDRITQLEQQFNHLARMLRRVARD
jgi:hypothetical protein